MKYFVAQVCVAVFVGLALAMMVPLTSASRSATPASEALRSAWSAKLGSACEPQDVNGVQWCAAYLLLKVPNSGSHISGPDPKVVHVTAIYRDGRVRLQERRDIHPIPVAVDPEQFDGVEPETSPFALTFRLSDK